ncbi:MAG: TetR/AcrR family transcriptional regulator [Acidimicrobiales bacterium]
MAVEMATGRRERNKQRTREAIVGAARQLFAAKGFDSTTVAEISDAADVAERTFFRYFQSKYDLLLQDIVLLVDECERAIAARPPDEPPLAAILAGTEAVLRRSGVPVLSLPGIDENDETLRARYVSVFLGWEQRLTHLLLARFGQDADRASPEQAGTDLRLHAGVVARCSVAATRLALRLASQVPAGQPVDPEAAVALLRSAFSVLAAGCPAP